MESAAIVVAAVVGVTGTLLAPVLAQRSTARTQRAEFERQQQAAHAQWEREQQRAELITRRTCYIEANAANRRYRIQLMNYLWHVRRDEITDAIKAELEAARQSHHSAFAEVQMVAAPAVLAELDEMAKALSEAYRRTKCLEEGTPDPDDSFEVIEAYLQWIWDRWKEMRAVMRTDLGVHNSLADPPSTGAL
ncbi:hypothetical protein JHN59_29330 [Streptomyces sp. MBT49]|uniref:hypothetical protein n=1 Tax=Streptomyces sp. MBT49 TaxID=1488380 RepID=UPI00190D0CC4|nr:hypothetical protein [Streptomyces sp. MBT49]MBK3628858.1 hypothetical protein [Streptomyces sp. MBT49]